MITRTPCFIIGCMLLGAAWTFATTTTNDPGFDRYRVIFDRKPFGEIIPAETAATTSAPSESLIKDLEMKGIVDDGNNMLRVAFLDKKANKTFYLEVGETNATYELVSVNYDAEEAVLKTGAQSSLFSLKPNKTPTAALAAPGFPSAPPGAPPQGLTPLNPAGAAPPARGFTPFPLSNSKKPFFSDMKKRKFSPFKPLGTNTPAPFQTQSLESFMKTNSGTAQAFPGQVRPFEPISGTPGTGGTIDGLLRANPEAARQFSPGNLNTGLTGNAIEGFLMQNQDQPPQAPFSVPVPAPEASGEGEVFEE